MWDEDVTFGACCDFFEMVSRPRLTRPKRLQMLAKFLGDCRKLMAKQVGSKGSKSGDDEEGLFPVVRLMLPQLDRERSAYGIKETLLAKLFIGLLKLGPNSRDAQRLKNYRKPASNAGQAAGDLASVLYEVVKDRAYPGSRISVAEINRRLDEMAEQSSPSKVELVLLDLFRTKLNASQTKWLVRIILKDMKAMGVGQGSVLAALHSDAKELYDVNANLRKVCSVLKDPSVRRHEIDISLFTPFRPMLAERADPDLEKAIGTLRGASPYFYIETKYDGERMQVHKEGSTFMYFSRNGHDFSHDLSGFSPYIDEALGDQVGEVSSIILDGEICAFNRVNGTVAQKGQQMNIRQLKPDDPVFQQCLYVYDMVYLNGRVLVSLPLTERLDLLAKVFPEEIEGRFYMASRRTARSREEVSSALDEAIDRCEEGIILKDPGSIYRFNVRDGGGWFKVKPEYNNELVDQCDLVVMGGYFGSGRRLKNATADQGQFVTHFLLGLVQVLDDGSVSAVRSFCRVGAGYSRHELFNLMQKLSPKFLPGGQLLPRRSKAPPGIELKFGKEKPDLWVNPQDSVIFQVKAAEIVHSSAYDVGCTLRFPRVEAVRHDKSWSDCMTVQQMVSIRQGTSSGKLSHRRKRRSDEDLQSVVGHEDHEPKGHEEEPPTSRRGSKRKPSQGGGTPRKALPSIEISGSFRPAAGLKDVTAISKALEGKVIVVEPAGPLMVASGGAKASKGDEAGQHHHRDPQSPADMKAHLERIVVQHGGTVEQNVCEGRTYCYIQTVGRIKAKAVLRSGSFNVALADWLLDCQKAFRPLRPSDMVFATEPLRKEFEDRHFDRFGDSYVERTTEQGLRHSLGVVRNLGQEAEVDREVLAQFEAEHFARSGSRKLGLFRTVTFYMDRFLQAGAAESAIDLHPLGATEAVAGFFGGETTVDLSGGTVTHAVVHSSDMARLDVLKEQRRKLAQGTKFRIVRETWVEDCLNGGRLIPEEPYLL